MEDSKIQWTHHTFNPWVGCTQVAPECDHCYAKASNDFYKQGRNWGPGAPRERTQTWKEPLKWNSAAVEAGERRRVFCASWADVFDAEVDKTGWRTALWQLVRETPNLDWLMLTKRPSLIAQRLPVDWGNGYKNVWLGTSVGIAGRTTEITKLLNVPAAIHFLSAEPLLTPVKIAPAIAGAKYSLDWCILGGESGRGARACHVEWIGALLKECRTLGVVPFVKQLGSNPFCSARPLKLDDTKGGDIDEWPEFLRIREYPKSPT